MLAMVRAGIGSSRVLQNPQKDLSQKFPPADNSDPDRVLEDSMLAMVGAGIGGGLFLVTIVIIGDHLDLMIIMIVLSVYK